MKVLLTRALIQLGVAATALSAAPIAPAPAPVIKSDDTKSGFVQKDFVISMFIEPQPTLHNYRLIQQANFTTVLQEHAVGDASDCATSISLCEQLGLSVIALPKWGPVPKSDNILGVYLRDEPPLSEFEAVASLVSGVRREHPTWLNFVNLYPWYPSGPSAVPHLGCSSCLLYTSPSPRDS